MNVVETIQAVRAVGGSVGVHAGALIVDAPPDLPAPVWEALATHKATLLDLLAPRTTYSELAAQEEREAIQAESDPVPADALTFDRPRPARRCRLVRDTLARDPHGGFVTFPAGLEGAVADDLGDVGDPFQRIHARYLSRLERDAGRDPIVIFLDGRARVVEASSVLITEGD